MKTLLLTLILALGFVVTPAQETSVSLVYSKSNPSTTNYKLDRTQDFGGVAINVTNFETKNVGLTAEGSASFSRDFQVYTGMAGLKLRARADKSFKPFVKATAGLVVHRADADKFNSDNIKGSLGYRVAVGADVGRRFTTEIGYLQSSFHNRTQSFAQASVGYRF